MTLSDAAAKRIAIVLAALVVAGDYTLFRSTVQCRPTAPDRHPG